MAGLDLADQYAALRTNVGAAWIERDVIGISGPEALEYLQGQLSQDIASLEISGAALSFLLEPQGKVVALLRVTRTDADRFVVDVDAGAGPAVIERLQRFKLRTKADITALDWRCLALRGPNTPLDVSVPDGLVVDAMWPGVKGVDLLGPDVDVPAGVPLCADAIDIVQLEAGFPRVGVELSEKTIPGETGFVDRAVSFTKGCYTGQELVARVDSRGGNVPRRLQGLVLTGHAVPPPGARIIVDGVDAGETTRAAARPGLPPIALAWIKRGHEPPFDGDISWDGGATSGRVEVLPLVP